MEHDPINHPKHYTGHPSGVECIEITRNLPFSIGNAVKYIWRAGRKGDPLADLRKARWYIGDACAHTREPKINTSWIRVATYLFHENASDPVPCAILALLHFRLQEAYDIVDRMIDDLERAQAPKNEAEVSS